MDDSRVQLKELNCRSYDKICNAQDDYRAALDLVSGRLAALSGQELRRGPAVVELGCGTGECTCQLAEVTQSVRITAVDCDERALNCAERKLASKSLVGKVSLVRADAMTQLQAWVGERRYWDVVISTFTFHNWDIEYRTSVLTLLVGILGRGGQLIIADYFPRDVIAGTAAFRMHVRRLFDIMAPLGELGLLREWVSHTIEDMAPSRIMYEDAAIRSMKDVGFAAVHCDRLSELTAVISGKIPLR